ncbi:Lin0368 family putative glycerol transporter subunit [Vagococcus xieshaowenii]|uniref:Uncharacterized protein n=1 Tax=Vagococcus xieshaowenii TaxID=2562451 RepID=A0AAJ5JL51_9ENTE|nr:hypothetical protein [Vagococcus xieshaowenii]QCA29420.1 hypothetical protein E4Z98_08865 [Vagococcus xieshaowenii]TFZ41541.1 hypothetical protein E4031_04940 [Vagococcus xieshaowenii]
MTTSLGIATLCGSFIFPFMIRMSWGKMVDNWGPIGGWMAALFIVGTAWCLNHGISTPMITQSGAAWVDQGLAAGVGVWVASSIVGGNIKKSIPKVVAAILAGIVGGFLLSLFL